MEYLDVLNNTGEKTGTSVEYNDVHKQGLIHRTVHVWLINSKKQLLLQKRSANKRAYPNLWDISAAGHVATGETSLDAAKKETREELGLDLPDDAFTFLATLKQPRTIHGKDFIDDEFNDVYLVKFAGKTTDFVVQTEEVEEIRWVDVSEFQEWIKGKVEPLVPHEEEYKLLLKVL